MDAKENYIKQSLSIEMFSEPRRTSRCKRLNNLLFVFDSAKEKIPEFTVVFSFFIYMFFHLCHGLSLETFSSH